MKFTVPEDQSLQRAQLRCGLQEDTYSVRIMFLVVLSNSAGLPA